MMRFSGSFIVFLSVALSLLILGNIASIIRFAPGYFNEYVTEVRQQNPTDESALIDAFIESKELNAAEIDEYRLTLKDLRDLTQSLETYSESQRLSDIQESTLLEIGFTEDAIKQTLVDRSIQNFLSNILSIAVSSEDSPERSFLLKILTMLLYVNAVLISAILWITFAWTKFIFRTTHAIYNGLSKLTERKEYVPIIYKRRDEFAPLIMAVNTLSQSLAAQEKIRSDFLSDFSHEIKTPITALKVFMEWIEDGIVALDEKGLSIVQSELDRLLATTDSIMQYEKIVAMKNREESRETFDLFALLSTLRDEYIPILARNSQMVSFEDSTLDVFLERDITIQLLHNVFSNFSKYAGNGTTLVIRAQKKGRKITVWFDDDGRGVQKANVRYLTEKFYQEDEGRSHERGRGIGIGLSLVEKIAKRHGWFVSISSDRNKGFHLKVVFDNIIE